ncbi:MAG TPA: protein-disulfide isomerase [Bacteroidales bacterium]|nr:protein-disulfide isomerase [Bacteroidales bacterium]
MKNKILALIISIAIFYSCNSKEKKADAEIEKDIKNSTLISVGQDVPEFSFIRYEDTVDINDFKGKVVFINFFATSCPICIKELPVIHNEIWSKYNSNSDFEFFVFGRGHTAGEMDTFRTKWEYTFEIIPDPERAVYSLFAKQYIPRNIIINREGKIIFESTGFDDEKFAKMKSILEKELKIK